MKSVLSILFIILAAFAVDAQEKETQEYPQQLTIAREGWFSPVFADDVSEVSESKPEIIDGILVDIKTHKFAKEQLVFAETCFIKNDAEAVAKETRRDFIVRGFTSYEFEGKVFAYRIYYFAVESEDRKIIARMGAVIPVFYVDENGDGRFELVCPSKPNLEKIPRWAKGALAEPPPPPPQIKRKS